MATARRRRAGQGRYLDVDPTSLAFCFNNYGKPRLAEETLAARLDFNVSHSGEWVVLAVTAGQAVGVDIERHRPLENIVRMGERFFSSSERDALRTLSGEEQANAFFRCWTRKEAYIKAVGTGIFAGLDQFDVTLLPGDPPRVKKFHSDEYEPGEWSLHDVDVVGGYSAAVMVRMAGCAVQRFDFEL